MSKSCANTVRPRSGPRCSDGDGAGDLLIVDDEVGVALVVVEDDVDLRVHPVVHARVEEVAGGVAGIDGRRSPHGGIPYGEPEGGKKREVFRVRASQ